jgi:hypothetical protein
MTHSILHAFFVPANSIYRAVLSLFGPLLLLAMAATLTERSAADDVLIMQPPEGFETLLVPGSFEGWHGRPHLDPRAWPDIDEAQRSAWQDDLRRHWEFDGDEIVNDGHGVYLTTDTDFEDFELLLQYRTVPLADSGVYLRGSPQVQIWDSTEEAKFKIGADKGSGGLWNNSPGTPGKDPLVLADRPFGEWNQMRIRLIGQRCSVWLNGQMVVDHAIMENFFDREQPLFRSGPIQLQTHGGEIRWRCIYIRPIEAEEANQILIDGAQAAADLQPLFNGHDLSGWSGAVADYEVVEGSIQCRPGKGGTLYTNERFGDFQALVEFWLPPGGNNGLAIRYPGSGDPAYTGMCELQVLDDSAEKYASLDPRQYHGSAYGMVAAHRGFLRPVGQWNVQWVTVQGSKIQVELNGNLILQADLGEVTEFMGGRPHPGKDMSEGHFGFAGHSDPVRFRNVMIRRL